jgi:carboxymethylenebutenolidase
MPLYRSDHVEYNIDSGHISIVKDDGQSLPAYWARPNRGTKFPGVVLIHNWWGMTDIIRRMAHTFATTGYYVIIPDLFNGVHPKNHSEAIEAVKNLSDAGWLGIDAALSVLETHHLSNHKVAAVGIGLGGSLAYEAAIKRDDLEVAVAFYGFPHKYFGQFRRANTPILGIYGDKDAIIKPMVVNKLREELAATPIGDQHKIVTLANASHDFVVDAPTEQQRMIVSQAWQAAQDFIRVYAEPPVNTRAKRQ